MILCKLCTCRTSGQHQSLNLSAQQSFVVNEPRCYADSPDTDDVYVDVTTSDPVYEPIQLQPYESPASCIAAESTEKPIENTMCTAAESPKKLIEEPMCEAKACPTDEDRVENLYSTIPGQ